jgi:hypothetical protein
MHLSYRDKVENSILPLVERGNENIEIYFIGSLRDAAKDSFHTSLSDVDLLIIPNCDSINDYLSHFNFAMRVASELNGGKGQLADVFLMSSSIAYAHYSFLSVFAGTNEARVEDRIFGENIESVAQHVHFPSSVLKKFYVAKATRFCNDYGNGILSVADTSMARKTTKELLRGIKTIICASVDDEHLASTEKILFSIGTFGMLKPIFKAVTKHELRVDKILDEVLAGKNVDDWPRWMIAQDRLSQLLMKIELDQLRLDEERRFDAMGRILRDMLIVDAKNVISIDDDGMRIKLIEEYINNTASIIVKLALTGVDELGNFEHGSSPDVVIESYELVVDFLKKNNSNGDLRTFTAATILLEYAFNKGLEVAMRNYPKISQ